MSRPDGDILVLGIGNILLRDEGVGVRIAEALIAASGSSGIDLPRGTRVVDGGTLGLDLLPLFDEARAAILIDAVNLGLAPGTVVVLRGEQVGAMPGKPVSAHELGLVELVEAARLVGNLPASISIVGVEPADISVGLELTSAVQAAVPRAMELVRDEAWGIAAP